MKMKKKGLWVGLCSFFAMLALAVGIGISQPATDSTATVEAAASSGTPTVTMVGGASVRKVAGSPGIKFTATIDNYNSDYQYGMLILPEAAWEKFNWNNDTDYIAALESIQNATYAREDNCTPYIDKVTGEWRISFALTNLYDENFDLSLVGVAYTLKDGVCDYADIDLGANARSISYVSAMALKYDQDLTNENIQYLEQYANGNLDIEQDGYFDEMSGGGTAIVTPAQYEIKYTFNVAGETVALKTKKAYAGGSTVSFKYYIPEGTTTSWWGVAWHTDISQANIYHAAGAENPIGYEALGNATGGWVEASFTLSAGGPYYLYFGSEVGASGGRWMLDGENAYALIKDFKIGDQEHTVGENGASEMFTMDGVAVKLIKKADVTGSFVGAPKELGTKLTIDLISSTATTPSFITAKAYTLTEATTITFDYYMSNNTLNKWWTLAWTNNNTVASIYAHVENNKSNNDAKELPTNVQDEWATASVTVPAGTWYFYFAGAVGEWSNGYVIIDNFKIGNQVTETFNNGDYGIFLDNRESKPDAITIADGYVEGAVVEPEAPEKIGDLALKILFNNGDDGVRVRTTKAYAGGSTIEFKYYIQADTATQWTRFIWDADTSCSNYADTYTSFGNTAGSWVTWSYTLPSGGPYYLYFGFECGNWKDSSGAPYILIDEFTVNGEVETFDYGVQNSIFTVLQSNLAGNSADGEGWVAPDPEPLGAKILINSISEKGQSFVSMNTYAGGGTVTFDYYMAGNTNNKWWSFCWSVSNNANNDTTTIYAHTGNYSGCGGVELPKVQDSWQTVTVNIPEGTWYFYIGGAKGEWGDGYVILDNIVIKDSSGNVVATEDFNYGFEKFLNNRPSSISLVEGKEDFVPGEYAMKYIFNASGEVVSQVTKQAYAGGSKVRFKYYIPAGTETRWWGIVWSTKNTGLDIYAAASTDSAKPLSTSLGEWTDVEFTLPSGGPYYLYFGSEVGNWKLNGENAYVLIDDFTVGNVKETFTNGVQDSIFNVLVEGTVVNSALDEGYIAPEEEPEVLDPNSLAAKLQDGTILEFLVSGGYAYLYANNGSIPTDDNMPTSMLRLEGVISYVLDGEKEFAIYFGDAKYLYVSETRVAFYNGTELLAEREISATQGALRISVSAGNVLTASLNGCESLVAALATLDQIKLVALGGDGGVTFNSLNITTYERKDASLEGVPVYLSAEKIDFTAYNFDSEAMVSEEGFALLAEAGFTKTLALQQGRGGGYGDAQVIPDLEAVTNLMAEVNRDAEKALTLAEKYGLMHYVLNGGLYNIERATSNYQWVDELADLATYTMSEAFAGHFLADEPKHTMASITNTELEKLVEAYKLYKQYFPEGEAFINLLPNTNISLSSDDTYTNYVKYYIENIALDKDGVKGTGYVSFDHYPLKTSSITSSHLRNLEIVAELCRDYGVELRTYIKASEAGDGDLRATQSVNDLYMQIYSALAYGSKEIIYYTFTIETYNPSNPDITYSDTYAGDAVINGFSLYKSNVYNWAKQANNEVKAFSSAYMNFTWKSASVFGKTSLTQFNNLKSKASAYGYLSSVSSSASVLVGNFDDADGKYTYNAKNGYMVVNYGDTGSSQATSSVTMTFNGTPNRALVYENGAVKIYTLSNNQLTLNLELGEGAFVIPLT